MTYYSSVIVTTSEIILTRINGLLRQQKYVKYGTFEQKCANRSQPIFSLHFSHYQKRLIIVQSLISSTIDNNDQQKKKEKKKTALDRFSKIVL